MTLSNLDGRLHAIRTTEKFDAQTLAHFAEYIRSAPDEELYHMSPLRYAERMNLDTVTAVDLFLYATHAGILEFSWGAICPSCGAFLHKQSGLRWLHTNRQCFLCHLDTIPSPDEQIEVAFTVSPSVRAIRFHNMADLDFKRDGFFTFFSTSVVLYPEVHRVVYASVQAGYRIPAASTFEIRQPFEVNHYLLMVPATHAVAQIPVSEGSEAHEVEFELLFDGQFVPLMTPMAPGDGVIRIHNRTNQAIMLGFLRDHRMIPWPAEKRSGPLYTLTPFLTGKELINSQTFRDLFRTESIPPAGGLEVKNLTLLFTDIKGSTSLYERIGDFNAYALVREHFALLREIVAARHGAIVKTMGDAIMASFANPASALEAAAVMRQQSRQAGKELTLKIGLHSGGCVAVESNEQLDYFGQTVNLASRVQAVAEAGEIVCTESVYQAPEVAGVIERMGLVAAKDQALLKGVDNPVTIYRLL
jgi:class 3 adenylate cyclase